MNDPANTSAVPRHIAVIMDGNGRWAKKRQLGRARGHREGIAAVRTLVGGAVKAGVSYLTLFTFSSENWGRPALEVKALMGLLATGFPREAPKLKKMGVRVRVIGDRSKLPAKALKAIEAAEEDTKDCVKMTLVLAISYGGRDEILHAVKRIVSSGAKPEEISEERFREALYAPDIPDPDLLIRTSGESRLSNFLLWQLAYTEIYITEVLWPDFGPADFSAALSFYAGRNRRFGLLDEQLKGDVA